MKGFRRNFFRFLIAALLSFASSAMLWAQTPAEAGAELARRIVARIGPGRTVVLKIRNLSSLKPTETSALLAALENELQSHGIRSTAEPSGGTEIVVTVSENVRGPLAVAQIRHEGEEEVAIVAFARPAGAESAPATETVRLEKELLIDLDAPILDAATVTTRTATAGKWLLVLQPDGVRLFEKTDAGWAERSRAAIRPARPWPRDLRGRLLADSEDFWAYLPGTVCGGALRESRVVGIAMDCLAVDDPWPVQVGDETRASAYFSPARNFFDGRIETPHGAHTWPPFFAAAPIEVNGGLRFVLTGLDGRAGLFGDKPEPVATFSGWGSDVATVKTPCGAGWQVLVTGAGDSESADTVRAFEVTEREAVAVSSPISFPGPVTVLWPASGTSARAVTRNRKTGRYEAYILTATCNR